MTDLLATAYNAIQIQLLLYKQIGFFISVTLERNSNTQTEL